MRFRHASAALLIAMSTATGALAPVAGAQRVSDSVPRVRLPFPQEDGSLTPYTFELGYPLVTLVYDTLLWRDRDGVPQPWLATDVTVDPDGRRLVVRIDGNARWHDGTPLTAEDVAFTFRYVAGRNHERFTRQLEPVDRVQVTGAHELVIFLKRPAPGFRDQPLADLPILPAHLWARLGSGEAAPSGPAVGSGPYRLASHEPGVSYAFEANPDYFRGRPVVDRIDVPIIAQADAAFRALERRDVDMVPVSLPGVGREQLDTLAIRVKEGLSYVGTALVLNTRQPPFDRADIRRAVSKALDLGRIASAVGSAIAADRGMLHPDSAWALADPVHVRDEAAAKAALASVTVALRILTPDNDPVKLEAARQVAQTLTRAGIKAEPQALPPAALRVAREGTATAPASFLAAIDVVPPLASYDPDFLRYLFASDRREASFNVSGYASSAFDGLALKIATTIDPAERRQAAGAALRLLAEDAPVIPLFFSAGAFAYRPAIYDGWVYVKGTGILDKRSFVEPAARAAAPANGTPSAANDRSPLADLALGFAVVAAGLAGLALLPARRRRPNRSR